MESRGKVEWNKAATLRLIELWQQYPFLYDTKNKLHNNRHARSDALIKIAYELRSLIPEMTESDVRSKMTNLRTQYNHELKKEKTGNGTEKDIYVSNAYWYDELQFLKKFMTTREGQSYSEIDRIERKPRISVDMSQVMDTSNDPDSNDDPLLYSLDNSRSSTDTNLRKIKKNYNDDEIENNVEAIQRVTPPVHHNSSRYDQDVETFGEFIKSELQSVQDEGVRDDIKYKIYNIIYEEKKSLRKNKKTKT